MEPGQRLEVTDDVRLEVATAGPPDAPVLLFLHGNGPNARQFAPQFATFADGYRLIALSLRGHGRSDMPATPTVDEFTVPRLAKDVLTCSIGSRSTRSTS